MSLNHAFRGSLTDHPGTASMVVEIGKLVVNAGAIEMLVDVMIVTLEETSVDMSKLRKLDYSERVDRLKKAAAGPRVSKALQKRLDNALDAARDSMRKRNTIAHGSLSLMFRGEATPDKEPYAVGVLDLKRSKQAVVPFVTLPELQHAVNEAQRAARSLEAILDSLRDELFPRRVP